MKSLPTKTYLRIALYVGVLAIVIGFRTVVHFFVAQNQVTTGKSAHWTDEFRIGFVSQCENSVTAQTGKSRKRTLANESSKNFKSYCECLAHNVEDAHIISPYFNPVVTSEQRHRMDAGQRVNRYLATAAGQTAVKQCLNRSFKQ